MNARAERPAYDPAVVDAFERVGPDLLSELDGDEWEAAAILAASPRLPMRRGGTRRSAASGLVHDLGRVAVENGIWDKPGPLTTSEWEQVRLHAHYTERILHRCRPLASILQPASSHHERVDGSGYHRSLPADALSHGDRILAAVENPYRKIGVTSRAAAVFGMEHHLLDRKMGRSPDAGRHVWLHARRVPGGPNTRKEDSP